MQTALAALIAVIIVLVLLVLAAYVWYNYTGWQTFSYATNDTPSWMPPPGYDISRLRFKDVIFTVVRRDGVKASYDVSPALNSMATGYDGGTANPPALTLVKPLNPFSFVIPGFNSNVSDPTTALWCAAPPASCASDAACPGAARGSCSCSDETGVCPPNTSGTCSGCPDSAVATLTGKFRTI